MKFRVTEDFVLEGNVVANPSHEFYKNFLKNYYVITKDGQYLFGSTQPGRRPDRAFYMVPDGYKLGYGQKYFEKDIGKKLFNLVLEYIKDKDVLVTDGVQGEKDFETGIRVVTSLENPHNAYMSWMGKLMMFPFDCGDFSCFNYIVQEKLPEEYIGRIKSFWPGYDQNEPITLYDFTDIEKDKRRVLSLGVDYFGGAFKKPNLTMTWNRAESNGMVSYHAGCTNNRVLKGLSGTGKTTLTLGPDLEQDDALVGIPVYTGNKVSSVILSGLEASSFAKSEGLNEKSPEWPGLMSSRDGRTVLCMNIDCENVEYKKEKIKGHEVNVPRVTGGHDAGSLIPSSYKCGTTNGRFVFSFDILNSNWGKNKNKFLGIESLSFRRFDIMEPIFRVTDSRMAVALDSACESIITSAVAGRKAGERVRSYSATDFMAREQSQQALLKWKIYNDLGLDSSGSLIFFINNSGYVGECPPSGKIVKGRGEKIRVEDSKRLINLLEKDSIENWIVHPVFLYLIPNPREVEEKGVKNFSKRFNPMRYYTPREFLDFCIRDIEERTSFLKILFRGQENREKLEPVINIWDNLRLPDPEEIKDFYDRYY